jgi:hypothetical protein
MATILVQKSSEKYDCVLCDYYTSRKSQYDRHILTSKHINLHKSTGVNKKVQESSATFECNCGKIYKERTGLWRHKKKCVISNNECSNNDIENVNESSNIIQKNVSEKDELINYLLKENQEFKNLILEIIKKDTNQINNNTTNNTTHTNSHNKAFNLNFFLNETCKDAMNIMDFVESIKLQVSDLESVGELGYIEGISNIIVKNLNALDVTQRPVHCTDKKRETIYIKDDNKWEKDEERKMMHKMIKKVADKNARLLPKFTEKYPDYKNYHSKNSDKYSKIIIESMGGSGDNDYEKEEKIIKNIAKNIVVDK